MYKQGLMKKAKEDRGKVNDIKIISYSYSNKELQGISNEFNYYYDGGERRLLVHIQTKFTFHSDPEIIKVPKSFKTKWKEIGEGI